MDAQEILHLLTICIPVTAGIVAIFGVALSAFFLRHITKNAVVGGQPREMAVQTLTFAQEEAAKREMHKRALQKPVSAAEVFGN